MATTAMPSATTTTATATTASTAAATSRTSAATATITSAFSARRTIPATTAANGMRTTLAIEVWLVRIIRKIAATFNHQRSTRHWLTLDRRSNTAAFDSAARCRHLRALLFQN